MLWSSKVIELDVCGRPFLQIRSHISNVKERTHVITWMYSQAVLHVYISKSLLGQ